MTLREALAVTIAHPELAEWARGLEALWPTDDPDAEVDAVAAMWLSAAVAVGIGLPEDVGIFDQAYQTAEFAVTLEDAHEPR